MTETNEFLKEIEELRETFYEKKVKRDEDTEDKTIYVTDDEDTENLMYKIHDSGGFLPDDYKYKFTVKILDFWLDTMPEDAETARDSIYTELEPDIYNWDLLKWVSSHLLRGEYVNTVLEEYEIKDFFQILMAAQKEEIIEIAETILNYLN